MKKLLLFLIFTIPVTSFSQGRNGTFNGSNQVHYQSPSTDDLSFLKENEQSVDVFVFPLGGDRNTEIADQLKGIKSILMNKLLENGVTLESSNLAKGEIVKNEIQVGVNVLKSGNDYSYVTRVLVQSGAYTNYEDEYSYKAGLILWEDIHFGKVRRDNFSQIRSNILSSIDRLIESINF